MARLSSGRNGRELLRVEKTDAEGNKRLLSFMSKGPVLEKVGAKIDGVWYAGKWRVKGKRRIGTKSEMITEVKHQLLAAGWTVTFCGSRKFQTKQEKRTLVQRDDTKQVKKKKPARLARRKAL